MIYNYQVSSIIGASYQNSQICFTHDGDNILSPVGNNVSLHRLKKDEIKTFQVHSSYNIEHIALSPKEAIMLCINQKGEVNIISIVSGNKMATLNFKQKINCVSFSPDGKMFGIGYEKSANLFWTPTFENKIILYDTYDGPTEDVTSISWTDDSKEFLVGALDHIIRVYAVFGRKRLIYSMDALHVPIVKTSFMKDSLDVLSVSKNGHLCYFKCNEDLNYPSQEEPTEISEEPVNKKSKQNDTYMAGVDHIYRNIRTGHQMKIEVTVADFHRGTNLLVTGFIDGRIMIHKMPEFSPRFTMRGCQGAISSISFNPQGSWIAIASSINNELNVLCRSSRCLIYQFTGDKRSSITAIDYSSDGNNLVTGGHDGVVKLWQLLTGKCIATFSLHCDPVTGVAFPRINTQLFFSSSLDGTVRCYELSTLKNFCILTAEEKPYQFSCVSSDDNGDQVAAGDVAFCFSVLVWSVETEQLIYTLSGHEQPVSSVMFFSVAGGNCLVSGSLDSTMRIWQLVAGESMEVIKNTSDVLAVAIRPDGLEFAGALLSGVLIFITLLKWKQTHKIDGKKDLGITNDEEKMFQTICYSPCGQFLLAGGNSKFICLYGIESAQLIRRFEISCNKSLEGVLEVHDRRCITDRRLSVVHTNIDAIVSSIKFLPNGTRFSAATSEGMITFSTERRLWFSSNYIGGCIDCSQVHDNISSPSISKLLDQNQFDAALSDALKLKNIVVLANVIESVPFNQVLFIIEKLNIDEVRLTLCRFVAYQLRNSTYGELYALWAKMIMCEWTDSLWKSADFEWKAVMINLVKSLQKNRLNLDATEQPLRNASYNEIVVYKNNISRLKCNISPQSTD